MKDRLTAVAFAALTFFLLVLLAAYFGSEARRTTPHHTIIGKGPLMYISVPSAKGLSANGWDTPSQEEDVLRANPPSNMRIAYEIKYHRAIEDFVVDGWAITFEAIKETEEEEGLTVLYRAIAARPGSTQYSYQVRKTEAPGPFSTFRVAVEAPVPIQPTSR